MSAAAVLNFKPANSMESIFFFQRLFGGPRGEGLSFIYFALNECGVLLLFLTAKMHLAKGMEVFDSLIELIFKLRLTPFVRVEASTLSGALLVQNTSYLGKNKNQHFDYIIYVVNCTLCS